MHALHARFCERGLTAQVLLGTKGLDQSACARNIMGFFSPRERRRYPRQPGSSQVGLIRARLAPTSAMGWRPLCRLRFLLEGVPEAGEVDAHVLVDDASSLGVVVVRVVRVHLGGWVGRDATPFKRPTETRARASRALEEFERAGLSRRQQARGGGRAVGGDGWWGGGDGVRAQLTLGFLRRPPSA